MRTHGHREGLLGGIGEGHQGVGSWGEIARGEMPDIGDGGSGGSKPHCHVCTYATMLHDLPMYTEPKVQ